MTPEWLVLESQESAVLWLTALPYDCCGGGRDKTLMLV